MRALITVFFIAVLWSLSAGAAPFNVGSDGLSMSGDSVSRDFDTRTVTLEGNVEISIGLNKLLCDKAVINLKKNEVVAEGNISLISPDTVIEGSKIRYNYKTGLGTIENGFVQAGQVVFEGKVVEKTGETSFHAKDAKFTSCKTCPPAWSFSGTEIKADVGGYAWIKYPLLRVANFPIFILPRILIPLKSERQSGLLVPDIELSKKDGLSISQSYFWAINRSQDLTYTLTSQLNRGLKNHIEHRYVLSETSRGHLHTAYLHDKAFSDNGKSTSNLQTLNRAFFHYRHYYDLPDNMVHRANINWVTDLRYPRDFPEELEGHGDPALENSISLTQNTETQHRSIEVDYYINLLQADKLANNDDAVHRFPEINFSSVEQQIYETGLYWKFDFNYVNFARRNFSYDDVTPSKTISTVRDGSFDPANDQIRTGHRFIFEPSISYPILIDRYVEVLPTVSYNETQYRFNTEPDIGIACPNGKSCDRNAVRRHLQTDLAVRTKYSRVFGPDDQISNRYKHEIQPELVYSVIPWAERPNHVFFGNFENQPYSRRDEQVTNADFFTDSKIQYDYKDRLFNKRLATWVLTNSITRKRYVNENAEYSKLVMFRLMQSYDFYEKNRERPRPWSPLNALLNIRGDQFETATNADFYPYAKVVNWNTRLRYNTIMQNYAELTYTREVFITQESKADPNQKNENYGLGLGTKFKYIDFSGTANFSAISNEFSGWEYVAVIKPPGECFSLKFGQRRTVGSDIKYKVSFNFLFGE